MKPTLRASVTTALLLLAASQSASAQVYGSLANFDAVNDTGYVAHGFEIRIEDSSFDHTKIQSIFGYDRDFGVPPQSVVRYGAPTVEDLPGVGVLIRYAASFSNGAWNLGTPTGPYANAGDSCWPFGNPLYASGALSCDHFGVGTYANPAKTTYSWLVDPENDGTLAPINAGLPPVNFFYAPVGGGGEVREAPEIVVAEIEAEKDDNEVFGEAYWVKTFAKHVDHNVGIDDLMKGNDVVPDDDEVEVEWELFQAGDEQGGGGGEGGNGRKRHELQINPEDAALVLRYEFYRYQGAFKADGEADCSGKNRGGGGGGPGPDDCGGLGEYVGAQMAGFNAVQPPGAVVQVVQVPEPGTYAMLAAGLGLLGLARSRRSNT